MTPTKDELQKRYSTFSNEKLLSIIQNQHEYTQDAVDIAKIEINSRNISTDEVNKFVQQEEQQKVVEKILSYVPLNFWEKVFYFFVWFAPWFMGGAFRMNYSEDGLILKLKQSKIFAVAGFIALFLNVFIGMDLNLSTPSSVGSLILLFLGFYWIEKIPYKY